jgi:hypothetical protein
MDSPPALRRIGTCGHAGRFATQEADHVLRRLPLFRLIANF